MAGDDVLTGQAVNIGQSSLPSSWRTVQQADIDAFGKSTDDMDPMHVEPAWAAANGPFGGTIAFGFWTLAMLTSMVREIAGTSLGTDVQAHFGVNYGFNRVRFVEPVRVGARIRAIVTPIHVDTSHAGRILTTMDVKVEIEGSARPALVAEWLSLTILPTESGRLDGFRRAG
ncbi:MaoC family dehydratase [Sandaracinobacteroides saxicola]|uniref:MaoC family dehydratase n=1 Tax=Sandaracinobacteroides saxicola TaxID=2759707 RepID=A0A7G5IDX8_9SPHN|nr:MaoC family dehydratase [Sandaracinobacteroides saxicola]QMW21570.1 MaoC family dehydratase [Sandaracinobacteroides saxicola]